MSDFIVDHIIDFIGQIRHGCPLAPAVVALVAPDNKVTSVSSKCHAAYLLWILENTDFKFSSICTVWTSAVVFTSITIKMVQVQQ